MAGEQQRHDISDKAWERIRPYTIGEKGTRGGNARDTRQFINGVFWILRTGAPWRDLPETYGNWKNVHRRFCRWRDKGIWERILEALVDDTDFEWLMIDASHVKVHPDAAGARGGNQAMGRQKILRLKTLNQLRCNCAIRSGTRSDKESHRHTMRIHGQMYLGVEPPFVRPIA